MGEGASVKYILSGHNYQGIRFIIQLQKEEKKKISLVETGQA